jgi:hypothetical protein
VNDTTFSPGDRILLKRGTRYRGDIAVRGAGAEGSPIVIDAYGTGGRPRVKGQLTLYNVQYWEVRGLEISDPGEIGVWVHVRNIGPARHIHLQDLYIHDVAGGTVADTGGIICRNQGVGTWFDGLVIEGCRIERADRNGILITDYPTRNRDPIGAELNLNLNVVVRGNKLDDIGGDGIFIIGCDGALMEHNVVRYAHQRVGRGPGERACAGLWPHHCDNTVIQFNEVSHTGVRGVTVWDSEGFDSDQGCRNTLFQYNYSHDNAGGFLLICGGNVGTTARYNISQNDDIATFSIERTEDKPLSGARIHNNVIYVGPGLRVNLARNTINVGGAPKDVCFTNNIFFVEGRMEYNFGSIANVVFDGNAFFGNHVSPPADPHAVTDDPMLAAVGKGSSGMDTLRGYMLRQGSPCIGSGLTIPDNGGLDFWGNPVPDDRPPSIGAHEPPRPEP